MAIKGAIPVAFADVFPAGAFVLDVQAVRDYDASKAGTPVQARDKESGQPVWAVDVIDADPEARQKSVKVKISAPVCPVLPPEAGGLPFRPVEFDGLSVRAYVDGNGRVAYSFRASGMRAPAGAVRPGKQAA
ncbi:MAG TPA: plasmid replication, integration and excision activator [Mycobacteriales bacterium]|jgi:hypothetical protein